MRLLDECLAYAQAAHYRVHSMMHPCDHSGWGKSSALEWKIPADEGELLNQLIVLLVQASVDAFNDESPAGNVEETFKQGAVQIIVILIVQKHWKIRRKCNEDCCEVF